MTSPGPRRSPSNGRLSLTAHYGNGPRSAPLAEVWGISRCRRNRAEIAEGKERQMKRDSNPTKKMLNGAEEEGWEGIEGHMKTALLNWPSFPIPHTKTPSLKPEGR